MKIRRTTKPMSRIIPKDPANGVYEDKLHEWIGKVDVVDLADLQEWLLANPETKCGDLADMIDKGEFR